MKKEVSPVVVVIAIIVVVAAVAFFYVRGTSTSRNAADIEKTIQSGLAGGGPNTAGAPAGPGRPMAGPPQGVMPRPGGGPPMIQTGPPPGITPGR